MEKKFYITAAIDYVNAHPHIGHATEKIQADVLARFHRDVLKEDTFFLNGSDENSLKNVEGAKKAGKLVDDFVAENAESFKALKGMLKLSYDEFIRTTERRHFEGAQKMWLAMRAEDIYKKQYQGYYCVGCEEFKMPKDLVDGKCPDHFTEPELVEEENYFFRLSAYQDQLQELIENDVIKIIPEYRKNEMLSFVKMGLEDFSISRSKERAKGWGVPVPGDESQIMYVWVDALSNYITGLDYSQNEELYQRYWAGESERVHVIGKGILRFHAIYWPAMLLSAKLSLPTTVFSHEYLTINGQKISKSLGNVIDPQEVVEKFGSEAARYLLLSALPFSKDGDISWEKMTEKYNADLANGLGNLVSRVLKLSERLTTDSQQRTTEYPKEYIELLENYRLSEGLEYIWSLVRGANKYIDETRPWELAKIDQTTFEDVMKKLLGDLASIASLLVPFLPETAERIGEMLKGRKGEILFQRIK